MAFEGTYHWMCDWENKELLRVDLTRGVDIKNRFPIDVLEPIGVVVDGKDIWVLDGADGTIHSFSVNGSILTEEKIKPLPFFSGELNKAAGFGGNGKTLWVTSMKSGIAFRLRNFK